LKHFGHEVECAPEGERALQLYRHRHARESGRSFDVTILDLTLPKPYSPEELEDAIHEALSKS